MRSIADRGAPDKQPVSDVKNGVGSETRSILAYPSLPSIIGFPRGTVEMTSKRVWKLIEDTRHRPTEIASKDDEDLRANREA
ncbi:MAG: hypothetical protein MI867_12020, partial [Pseudomonadales bacterium]|nr:hypothetical protein [Pseudomonadales bacterium]